VEGLARLADLRVRDVVDVSDGARLGVVADVEIDLSTGRVTGLVIPGPGRLFGLLGSEGETVVPWADVVTIGADVILVRASRLGRRAPAGGEG